MNKSMEKKSIKLSGNFKMNELMLKGAITPNSNVCATVQTKGSKLQIELESGLENPQKVMLGFYDEGLKNCYNVCEGYVISKNTVAFNFDEEYVRILSAVGVSYYRMCVAVEYESEFSCFCIQSRNYIPTPGVVDYCGTLCVSEESGKTLAAYYSQGGRLSAKAVDSKKFFAEYYCPEITLLRKTDSGIELELSCKATVDQLAEPYLVSFNGKTVIHLNTQGIEGKKLAAALNFEDMAGREYTNYILKLKIGGITVDTKWSKSVQIEGCSLYEPISFTAGGEHHSISCAAASNTFEFDYIEKYYSAVFSVIIAVYNTELFVAETIENILAQDISSISATITNDKKTIYGSAYELILVDDGSTDSSGEICDRYAEKYPQIKVIHKENGGVSSARNMGLDIAGGKYINFLDSDDKFSNNMFKECFDFFENNYDEVNIISMPIKLFDAAKGDHWLNYKFTQANRVVDYDIEYDKPQLSSSSSVFKGDVIRENNFRFDTSLKTGEDCKFIYTILFETINKVGFVNKCNYWYRKRSAGEPSALDMNTKTRNHYIEYMTELLDWYVECSEKYYGNVPRFVQYTIAQFLQWRYIGDKDASIARSVLTEKEFEEYKGHMTALLKYIDPDIIIQQKKIFRQQKNYMLRLKYGREADKYYIDNDISYYYGGAPLATASTNHLSLEFIKIENGKLYLEGNNNSFEKNQEFFVCINDQMISVLKTSRNTDLYSLGEPIFFGYPFVFEYSLEQSENEYKIEFYEKIEGHYIKKRVLRCEKFFPLSTSYSKSYYFSENWVVRMEDNCLIFRNTGSADSCIVSPLIRALQYEKEFVDEILKSESGKMQKIKSAVELRNKIMPIKTFYNQTVHKKIWLVSDRVNMAGDNGEAFFLYLQQINDPDIDVYFVIGDQCKDYERMKQYGKVLAYGSEEHMIMQFLADCIISAQADEEVYDLFWYEKTSDVFKDMLYKPKFIFLQHGIIIHDMSKWLSRYNKNIIGFVTAATPEYNSIIKYNYNYSENEVWLTGLPRHDRLYNDEKHYITIMPTWRKYLSVTSLENPGTIELSENFLSSEFFVFYSSLLNNKRLLDAAQEYGYTICFKAHPNMISALTNFKCDPNVIIFETDKPYREIYAESSLIMTDYSSSAMDFAYLRKPIVYCQFDKEKFFASHTVAEGYFEYEANGFGEVTYDLESAIDIMIEYMKTECKLKSVYRERMDKFFAYNDKNNCERVYKKIKALH